MKIFYKQSDLNNNFEDICNYNKNFLSKSGSKAIIYKLKMKDKTYINKNYLKNDKSRKDFEIEKNKFFLVKKRSNTNILFKNFFIQYYLIAECKNNFIMIMEKMKHDLNAKFLKAISNDEKNNILIQILINIYDMNYYNKIYLNYIYIDKNIRNIMILINDIKINIEYNFNETVKIIIPVNEYKIKFIDYGNMDDYIKVRTIEYMKEYFKYLYDINIISESILFTFFYFFNCGLNEKNILSLINKIIKIILKSDELNNIISNNSEKNKYIDYLFIYYLVKYLSARPNFYDI